METQFLAKESPYFLMNLVFSSNHSTCKNIRSFNNNLIGPHVFTITLRGQPKCCSLCECIGLLC